MLSRTARLAALITIASGGLTFTLPASAAVAVPLACGDQGVHQCCVKSTDCASGQYCCTFAADGTSLGCGCYQPF